MKKTIILKLIILPVLFLFGNLSAQFYSTVGVSADYDDNLYRSPDQDSTISDLLTNYQVSFSYKPKKSTVSYYFNGDYLVFQDNSLRNFFTSNLGLNYSLKYGKQDKNTFYFGASWLMRLNQPDYDYYDYNQLFAFANFRFKLDYIFLKAGYNYRYRSYSLLPDLTNSRHYVFIQANKSFQTRTSVILEIDGGYKSFAGQDFYSSTSGSGMGGGSGRNNTYTTVSESEIPSLSQTVLLARVAQSLHDKLGIYVQYRKQISLTQETSFVNSDSYYQDEELFDDPFSFESDEFSAQLTWIMPFATSLRINGSSMAKQYVSELAFVSAEDTSGLGGQRLDDRLSAYISLSKRFFIKKPWLHSLSFDLSYAYIKNESNSYWYDYKNSIVSGGLQFNF